MKQAPIYAKTRSFIRMLGLSRNEQKIFDALAYTAGSIFPSDDQLMSVAGLSKSASLPRMSAHMALRTLQDRGLVSHKKIGKRKFWYRFPTDMLLRNMLPNDATGPESAVRPPHSDFTVLRGIENLYKAWEALLDLPPNTRVLTIQPTASMRETLSKLDWFKKIQRLQENIRKKPILMTGLLSEDYYLFLADFYKKDRPRLRKVLESFLGRATDMAFMDNKFLDLATELFILPDAAYITNWKEEVSVVIRNKTMISFLRELFELARGYGRHMDQNKYIEKLIDRLA